MLFLYQLKIIIDIIVGTIRMVYLTSDEYNHFKYYITLLLSKNITDNQQGRNTLLGVVKLYQTDLIMLRC